MITSLLGEKTTFRSHSEKAEENKDIQSRFSRFLMGKLGSAEII
jgi:hypothetical protein